MRSGIGRAGACSRVLSHVVQDPKLSWHGSELGNFTRLESGACAGPGPYSARQHRYNSDGVEFPSGDQWQTLFMRLFALLSSDPSDSPAHGFKNI